MCHRTRFLSAWGLAALGLLAAPPSSARAASTDVALSGGRVSMLEKGRIVASFEASGDARGLVTVTIDRDGKGGLSGEWVLVSRYVRDLNADGQVDDRMASERAALPGAELHGLHREYIDIFEGGSLRGSIVGGALAFDATDGALVGIESLQLVVDGGNLSFLGAKGTASLTASSLRDQNGTGALRLAPATTSNEGVK
jgi:hypothetical protein